jgi:iron complex outermembrane receptor protein
VKKEFQGNLVKLSGHRWLKAALCGGSALAGLMVSSGAMAQSAGGVEEIVVTVQRRAERLVDVPMSVASLTSESLEKANITNIHEIGRITPGVQINFGGSYTQPAIRGVTTLTTGVGTENNIATYVDGFYVSDNASINSDLANLAGLQVLKGPQGALYGRNATGGAILVTTLAPTKVWSGKIEGSYARFDEKKVSGYLSGPITDNLRFMVAGAFRHTDGWIKFSDPTNSARTAGPAAPIKHSSIRTKLEGDISDNIKVTLAYNYALSSDKTSTLFTTYAHIPSFLPGGNQRAQNFGTVSYNHGASGGASTNEYTGKIEFKTPIGVLTSYTGYTFRKFSVKVDFDGTYTDLTFNDSPWREKAFQQAFDYSIDAIEHVDLVVGGQYFRDRFNTVGGQKTYGANLVLSTSADLALKTDAFAVYADGTVHLSDAWSLGVGGRYSSEKRFVSQQVSSGAGVVTFPYSAKNAKFNRFTPRATLRYLIGPQTNVYAAYSKGFRSGSFNSSVVASPALQIPIKPEDINAYEIGFKTASSAVRFETAAWYYDYTNLNVSLTIPNPLCVPGTVCSPSTVTGNAPKAKIYGVDAQILFTPIERLNITIGGAWIHARYGTFPNAVGTGLNSATDTNISGQVQDWTGKQMARAPNFSANFNVDYTVPVAGGDLLLSANANYSDSYAISNVSLFGPSSTAALAGQQRFRQGSTFIVNARADWTDPTGRYTVGVFGKNLTNKVYRLTYNGGAFGDYSSKAAPVSYGVKAGYKF